MAGEAGADERHGHRHVEPLDRAEPASAPASPAAVELLPAAMLEEHRAEFRA